ncbi:class I adenylate-forming enzyme family protein [Haloglomus litoreum]|uniref:class I adenylate-forming enzyme family protein n=1 Tax=Haloglomus litoreum TaxID=3034026 RepID=UPI0023E7EE2F|nr:AMP-binding protein [Haloglomus sp. DT116]
MSLEGNPQTVDVERANEIARIAVGDMATRAGSRYPDRTAYIVPATGEEVTFGEFDERTNRAAHALLDAGLEKGDRLAMVSGNSLQFLTCYYGAMKAGIVATPINPEITDEDIAYEFDHSEATAVVADDVFHAKIDPLLADRDLDLLATIDWEGIETPGPSFGAFIEGYSPAEPEVHIEDDDLAQIMYTSGTTSQPKGVLLSHKAVHTGSLNVATDVALDRNDTMIGLMPLFHCAQLTMVQGAMHVSARTVIRRGFEPDAFLEDVETYDVSWSFMLPAMYQGLLARPDIGERDLSSLEYCLYAMTPMGGETLERAHEVFDANFALGSGQTEAYPPTCVYQPEWQLEKEGNYWGHATANNRIGIMDDDGNLLPDGEVGEIVYRGPNVMDGYLKNEAKTREAFAHGWFHSGDMGLIDEDGLLKFVDRKKDMIKSGGENVSTQKVESTLLDHPAVAELAVVGLPHERWGEAVTAFVVPTPDAEADAEEIREWVGDRLAGFETPKAVEFVDELPKTTTGKIQKFEVAQDQQDYYG